MRIAVASGKGGTGKTTVAVNLVVSAVKAGLHATYVDCDVEEPNGHIFLGPDEGLSRPVTIEVPKIDESLCTACGKCKEICEFNAIAVLGGMVMVFPELCHGCGGCFLVCPENAMERTQRPVGEVQTANARVKAIEAVGEVGGGEIPFVQGLLNIGEAMPVPVIREVKKSIPGGGDIVVVDSPPGNSCPMVEAVRGSDRVILVTEPTPFGLSDLDVALRTIEEMGIPVDVVLNRYDPGDTAVDRILAEKGVSVIARIPESREVAGIGSRGGLAALESPEFAEAIDGILERMLHPRGEDGR